MGTKHQDRAFPWILLLLVIGWALVTWGVVHVWGDWVKVFQVAVQYVAVFVLADLMYFIIQLKDVREERDAHKAER